MIPETCASQEAGDKYYANSKPVDILVASLHRAEFDHVEAPSFAHWIWSRLLIGYTSCL
ncbi:hypothetical protein GQ55_9G375400 [Panicum hallii var. hallii]|uniref:Uncharacterized protein n=1 Tax=Panicum hallii var. hallii TaxID=1504633 RepID=A0A2T7C9B6_9POAL|nr:hypothetical protein GQ55_9G375400 [Panicum hallii var. hallii]